MSESTSNPQDGASSPHPNTPDPQSVEGLFLAALGKAPGDEREDFLNEACADDAEQRLRINALLRAYDDAGSFLEKPPTGYPATQSIELDFLEEADDPGLLGTLDSYEVIELIGRGGMGMVFRARDPKLNRVVAIKVLAPELAANPNARRRFLREAQAAAAISHPHVVTLHAVEDRTGEGAKELPFLVMECVVGQTLQQKLDKQGSLRLTEVLRIGQQIAEGLAAAHRQGLIHRDIKPANVLLENGVERVKISDFGLARAVDDVSITRTGEVSGTPQYMSPEQAGGDKVDHRGDLFSLGCVMYAMCTGRSPFRATSLAAAIKRVCQDTPRPIEEINPELPAWMIDVVNHLLEKDPASRPQSASDVADLLGRQLASIQSPDPGSEVGRMSLRNSTDGARSTSDAGEVHTVEESATVLVDASSSPTAAFDEPTRHHSRMQLTPLGFVSVLGAVGAATFGGAVFLAYGGTDVSREVLGQLVSLTPLLLLGVFIVSVFVRRLMFPSETVRSHCAWGGAMLSGMLTCWLSMMLVHAWSASAGTLRWEPIAAFGIVLAVLVIVTQEMIRLQLRERDDADVLIARTRRRVANTCLTLGAVPLFGMLIWIFLVVTEVIPSSDRSLDYGPVICSVGLIMGVVFLGIGSIVRRQAVGESSWGFSPVAWFLLLGPLGIAFWLSHRDAELRRQMKSLKSGEGDKDVSKKRRQAIEKPESSEATMGRYCIMFGLLLMLMPYVIAIPGILVGEPALAHLGMQMGVGAWSLPVLVGVITITIGCVLRYAVDRERQRQLPLRLWRIAVAAVLLSSVIGVGARIRREQQAGEPVDETRFYKPEITFEHDADFPQIQSVTINGTPESIKRLTNGRKIVKSSQMIAHGRPATVKVVTTDGREFSTGLTNRTRVYMRLDEASLRQGSYRVVQVVSTDSAQPIREVTFADVPYTTDAGPFRAALAPGRHSIHVMYAHNGEVQTVVHRMQIDTTGSTTLGLTQILAEQRPPSAPSETAVEVPGPQELDPTVVPAVVGPPAEGERAGELTIGIHDDGMRVSIRRKSAFGGYVAGSEQQVTKFGYTTLRVHPGDYEVHIHDRRFGWERYADEVREVAVAASAKISVDVERHLDRLGQAVDQIGVVFQWNGRNCFESTNLGHTDVFNALLAAWKTDSKALPQKELEALYEDGIARQPRSNLAAPLPAFDKFWSSRPDCLVPGEAADSWRLAPVPEGTIRVVFDDPSFSVQIDPADPESDVSRRGCGGSGDPHWFTFRLPPGDYKAYVNGYRYGWVVAGRIIASPIVPTIHLNDGKEHVLRIAPDFTHLAGFVRSEYGIPDTPEYNVPFAWDTRTGESDRQRTSRFLLNVAQESVVRVLLKALADGQPEVAEQELLEQAEADAPSIAELFDKPGEGNSVYDALLVPGKTEGTWRLHPLPVVDSDGE